MTAHLDPDLRKDALLHRPKNWRPAFGQSGAAARHLLNQGFGVGDLFVFFGWFRKTIISSGRLSFDPADLHGRHIVFGWLEVGAIVNNLPPPDRLSFLTEYPQHPHVEYFAEEPPPNLIFVSTEGGLSAGVFQTEEQALVLTEAGNTPSRWQLDQAFESIALRHDLTYHRNEKRWSKKGRKVLLESVGRGQEFVFNADDHAQARDYLVARIRMATSSPPPPCSHQFEALCNE